MSDDVNYYLYAIDHPFCTLTGEVFSGPWYVKSLINYGPLLGLVIGGPIKFFRLFSPDFLAVRFGFVVLEALALLFCYKFLRQNRILSRAPPSTNSPWTGGHIFILLAALLPLGWLSTSFWAQEEILVAPCLLASFVAAVRDRPACAAMALALGAVVAKPAILAFAPVVWLVLRPKARFTTYLAFFVLPLLAYVIYFKARFGFVPLLDFNIKGATSVAISALSLYEAWGFLVGLPSLGNWLSPVSKLLLVGTVTALAVLGYKALRSNDERRFRTAFYIWLANGAGILLVIYTNQPEYLSWFAYLVPLGVVVLGARRDYYLMGGAVAAICLSAWAWNLANGVTVWASSAGNEGEVVFAGYTMSLPDLQTLQIVTACAGLIYLIELMWVLVWSWSRLGNPGVVLTTTRGTETVIRRPIF